MELGWSFWIWCDRRRAEVVGILTLFSGAVLGGLPPVAVVGRHRCVLNGEGSQRWRRAEAEVEVRFRWQQRWVAAGGHCWVAPAMLNGEGFTSGAGVDPLGGVGCGGAAAASRGDRGEQRRRQAEGIVGSSSRGPKEDVVKQQRRSRGGTRGGAPAEIWGSSSSGSYVDRVRVCRGLFVWGGPANCKWAWPNLVAIGVLVWAWGVLGFVQTLGVVGLVPLGVCWFLANSVIVLKIREAEK